MTDRIEAVDTLMDAHSVPRAPLGRRPPAAAAIAACAFLIIAAWFALELWGLGKTPFHTKGEPREGLVVWEMTHGGGWILPRRNGVELPSKPPLFHWLGAMTSLMRGHTDEWSIRFPSAALSLLASLGVFAAGAALRSPRAGVLSALVLMTTFEWARAATNARVDMTLTFALELAFLSLLFHLRQQAACWLVPLYIGVALAVLGKGPVGAALPALVALLTLVVTRDLAALRRMRLGSGALAVGVIAGSWYVLALMVGGLAFFRKQVLAENVFTFLDSAQFGGGHRHSILYLLGALLVGLLPWTLFLPAAGLRLWQERSEISRRDARVYLLVWIVVVFGFYGLAASKRSVYLLALYPAVALMLGWWWDEQIEDVTAEAPGLVRLLRVATWALSGVVGATFLLVLLESAGVSLCATVAEWLPVRARPVALQVSDAMGAGRWLLLGCLAAAGAFLSLCRRAARGANWQAVFVALVATVAAVLIPLRQAILPEIARHETRRALMADVHRVVGPADTVFFYKTFDYGAVFYWQGHIPTYEGPWPTGAPRYLLMQETEWERARVSGLHQYERVVLPSGTSAAPSRRLVLIRRVEADEQRDRPGDSKS